MLSALPRRSPVYLAMTVYAVCPESPCPERRSPTRARPSTATFGAAARVSADTAMSITTATLKRVSRT